MELCDSCLHNLQEQYTFETPPPNLALEAMRISPSSAAAKCRSSLPSTAALLLPLLLAALVLLAGKNNSGAAAARELRSNDGSDDTAAALHHLQGPSLPKPELAGAGLLPASSDGVRTFTLVLGEGFSGAGDAKRWGLTVNGTARPGPVLEAVEGETLSVTVENQLEHDNATLHWHGAEQAGTWFMDGVPGVTQCAIPPGGRFHYLFKFDKPGTFWYHSHSTLQYVDGLLGALIIHPEPKQETQDFVADIPEFVLLAHEWGAKPFREVAGPSLDGGSMMMGGSHGMMMGGSHGMMMEHNTTAGEDAGGSMTGGSSMTMGEGHQMMMMGGSHGMMMEHNTTAGEDAGGSMTGGSSMTMGNSGHQMMMGHGPLKDSMTGGSHGTEGNSNDMMMGGHKTMTGHKDEPVPMSKMLLRQGDASNESKHQGEEDASGAAVHINGKAASSAQDHSMMGDHHATPHDADFPWAPHLVNGKGGSLPPREQAHAAGGLEVIRVKAGGSARLRVINGSGNWALRLQIEGHVLSVLAADASPVAPQDPLLDYVLLGVGERMDILLAATQTPGAYWIYLSSLAGDHVSHAILLVEEGGALQGRDGMTMQTVPPGPVNPPDVGGPETLVDQARALSAAPSAPPMPLLGSTGPVQRLRVNLTGHMMPTYKWAIEFDHRDAAASAAFGTGFTGPVIRLAYGDVIDFELINQTPMDHAIHKHGSGFWVLDVQGHQIGATYEMMHERPLLFKDTTTVPRNGRALIRVKATDAGPWLFHCHTKAHADSGMMAGILVGDPETDWAMPPPLKDGSSYGRAGVCSSGQDNAQAAEQHRGGNHDEMIMSMQAHQDP